MRSQLIACVILVVALNICAGLNCNDGKVRGVNVGGWLVLEPWMTPAMFDEFHNQYSGDIIDEWTLAEHMPHDEYRVRLAQHWDTFYTKEELQKLSNSGISHIRIPVGYWLWHVNPDEPFPQPISDSTDPQSGLFYLKRMLVWMDELGLVANIDLHGAPGSQNGFDNSGRAGGAHWVEWGQVDRTKGVIRLIAQTMREWVDEGSFNAITINTFCVLNEPAGWYDDIWNTCYWDYYPATYYIIREYFDSGTNINIQQAFKDGSNFDNLMTEPDFHNVAVDMHTYQCFGDYWNNIHVDSAAGRGAHFDASCAYAHDVSARYHWTFSGEWSLGNAGPWNWNNPEYVEFLRLWFLSQIDAYEYTEKGYGWYFWNAKIAGDHHQEWNYLYLLDHGVAPSNLCQRETFCIFKEDKNGNLLETSYNKTMAGQLMQLMN